jgi:hypothetical protein
MKGTWRGIKRYEHGMDGKMKLSVIPSQYEQIRAGTDISKQKYVMP